MTAHLRLLFALTASVTAAAILVTTGGAASHDGVLPTLRVDYTMGCTFSIEDDAGRRVTSVAPGTYQVQVVTPVPFAQIDLSGIDDFTACKSFVQFQLSGPGVSLFTTLLDGDDDDDVLTATFQPSASYVAQDLNRAAATRTVVTTTATGSPTAPPSPYGTGNVGAKPTVSKDIVGSAIKSNPLRGTIAATVDASGKPKLLFNGKPVGTLKGGRYTTTVTDDSKKAGLVIQLLGKTGKPVKALTLSNVSFVGRHTTTVTLQKGQWAFATSDSGKRTYFIVVA
jgi:hypothetical protein